MIKITNKQLKLKISSRRRLKENKDWIMLPLILGEISLMFMKGMINSSSKVGLIFYPLFLGLSMMSHVY